MPREILQESYSKLWNLEIDYAGISSSILLEFLVRFMLKILRENCTEFRKK